MLECVHLTELGFVSLDARRRVLEFVESRMQKVASNAVCDVNPTRTV